MNHQQDVARRNIQHIRKDIVSTEGGLTPLYQSFMHSFMHYVWLAHSRETDLNIQIQGFKN